MVARSAAQLINQDSGKTQYYTPKYIIDAAVASMGEYRDDQGVRYNFELDPASDEMGNKNYVDAYRYCDEQLNGLNHFWKAETMWMNHPYGRGVNNHWINKAVSHYIAGDIKQACILTWASTSEKWAHPLLNFPVCFLNHRVHFDDEHGNTLPGSTKSSMVTYLGKNIAAFVHHFGEIGNVMMPYRLTPELTFDDYQFDAERTSNGKLDDERRIMCGAVGLTEEAGEVLGLHKKWNYHGHEMVIEKLVEELGDTLWYLNETAAAWGVKLEYVARYNIAKLRKRYPNGFERERSVNRE